MISRKGLRLEIWFGCVSKSMFVLMIRLNYTDAIAPATEAEIMSELYGDFTDVDTPVYGSPADMFDRSTYGLVKALPRNGRVITVQMGEAFGGLQNCEIYPTLINMENKAKRLAIEQHDVDLFDYHFLELFLPTEPIGCRWLGLAYVGCQHPTVNRFCTAWYRDHDSWVRAHELGHNL